MCIIFNPYCSVIVNTSFSDDAARKIGPIIAHEGIIVDPIISNIAERNGDDADNGYSNQLGHRHMCIVIFEVHPAFSFPPIHTNFFPLFLFSSLFLSSNPMLFTCTNVQAATLLNSPAVPPAARSRILAITAGRLSSFSKTAKRQLLRSSRSSERTWCQTTLNAGGVGYGRGTHHGPRFIRSRPR